jgi:hypothetical protein
MYCVLVCVPMPEVVAGKGRRPVEAQKGPMVRIGKHGHDQTKNTNGFACAVW